MFSIKLIFRFCSQIEIIDLQTDKYWLFPIHFQFEISKKDNYFFTATPDIKVKEKDTRYALCKKILNSFDGHHMWDIITYD